MSENQTADTVRRFNNAMNAKDLTTLTAMLAPDCIFEDTEPAPDGTRYIGADSVGRYMAEFLGNTPSASFEEEEMICVDDRCIVRSKFSWGDGHVRGVQVIRVTGGKISELLAYVKG